MKNNSISLRNRYLTKIWQHNFFDDNQKQQIDGCLVFEAIFSVEAFATKKEETPTKFFAKEVLEIILSYIEECTESLKKTRKNLGSIDRKIFINYDFPEANEIPFNQKKITHVNSKLIKLYKQSDNLISDIFLKNIIENLPEEKKKQLKMEIFRILRKCTYKTNKICKEFHKTRKRENEK